MFRKINFTKGKSINELRTRLNFLTEEKKFKGGPEDRSYMKKIRGFVPNKKILGKLGASLQKKILGMLENAKEKEKYNTADP